MIISSWNEAFGGFSKWTSIHSMSTQCNFKPHLQAVANNKWLGLIWHCESKKPFSNSNCNGIYKQQQQQHQKNEKKGNNNKQVVK